MKNKEKNTIFFYGFGVLFVLVVVGLIIGFSGSTTGAAVMVKNYGFSNELMDNRAGTSQTLIELSQPDLNKLGARENNVAPVVVKEIVKSEKFAMGIRDAYKNNPAAAPIPAGSLAEVKKAAKIEGTNFQKDLTCLNKIGKNYGHNLELKMVLVSELKYQECAAKYKNKLYANVKHSFYKKEDKSFLCSQESDKLFLINKESGAVNLKTEDC